MDVAIGLGEERSGRRREKRKKGRSTLRKKQKRRGRRKWKEQETRPTGGTGEVIVGHRRIYSKSTGQAYTRP